MKNVWILTKRNLSLFLHNKTNILLSFACIPIVVAMYVFFLKNFMFDAVREAQVAECLVKQFTNRFMCAGLLTVIGTTTCFGIIQTAIIDRESGIMRDFLIAPVEPIQIYCSYAIAATLVAFCYTSIAAAGFEVFFYMSSYEMLPFLTYVKELGIIFVLCFGNALLFLCFSFFINSATSFSTFANLFGTISGFLAGVYLPFALYPDWLQRILLKFFPLQITSLLRQLSVEGIEGALIASEGEETYPFLLQTYGILLKKQGVIMTQKKQWAVLFFSFAAMIALISIFVEQRHGKKIRL